MPAIITGDIITDAVVNLRTALESQKTTWEVAEVFSYPAWEVGKRGNSIAIQVVGWVPNLREGAFPTIVIDHKVTLKVWYFAVATRFDVAVADIYTKLSKIVTYLIEHPNPNSYGDLLIDDQAFGPTTETIIGAQTESGQLTGGTFTLVHTFTKSHTITLG